MSVLLLSALWSPPAAACTFLPNAELAIDESTDDAIAPTAPELVELTVKRGLGPQGLFGGSASSCDDLGWITLVLEATDDASPVGFRFALADGELPDGLGLPSAALEPASDGALLFVWGDEATDAQEPVAFTLAVTAVDAAGNEGPPLDLEVADPGSTAGGCASVPGGAWWAGLVALGLRRRAR